MAKTYQSETRGVVIGMNEMEKLRKHFAEVSDELTQSTDLIDAIGMQQAESAMRRIRNTKKSPAGKPWALWSQDYAKTRKPHHSRLIDKGHLLGSITHEVKSPHEVLVGSNLKYARAHLYGVPSQKLPARPYLDTEPGFADPHDRQELRDILRAFFDEAGL